MSSPKAARSSRARSGTSCATAASTKTSRERSPHAACTPRDRSALCRYLERHGAMQPLRAALLRLYESRPQKPFALQQLRTGLGDNRPNMQEWQQMKRQFNESRMTIASLTAEGERLRRRLEYLKSRILPCRDRSSYR